ncbi:synaptic vesicle glycoprotein 2A-like [Pieris brassicae]|uniref:synaptic vesicle glycoprotein 2A-like n=1 Tax=Pieris brassicae TaxID=7116 RepID=UPI001E66083A|nr:synaptic vesicle glycoprotein 2A-like [Pieris brassicae]
MSEVDLPTLAKTGRSAAESKSQFALNEVNLALKECGYGFFHVRLMLAVFVGLVTGVIMGSTSSYILSEAECDFDLDLVDKGVLNAMPYLGMLTSSIVAGFLTDAFGRKTFAVLGCGGTFVFTFLSGLSQSFVMITIAKFSEGVFFAAAYSSMLTLTSEFYHDGVRDRIMLITSAAIPLGQVIVALMSWGILIQDWKVSFFDGAFVLHTWNYYFLILSLWALLGTIQYILLPESPMFYISQKKYDKAREVLIKVYKENTGKPAETFKYKDLWKEKHLLMQRQSISPASQLSNAFHNIRPMFRMPLLGYLTLFCVLNFISMTLYTVLRMWFPQLSAMFEHYSSESSDICVIIDSYSKDLKLKTLPERDEVCIPARSGAESYINSLILGSICCIPPIISGVLVNKVGKRNLYIVCGFITMLVTIAIRWTNSKVAMVALFSSDVAISTLMASLTQTMVLQHFPTTTRSLAVAIVMTMGRTGCVSGNILFPILLDMGCAVPFFSLAAIVGVTTGLAFLISSKKE